MFFEKYKIYDEREIRFCGIPVLQYGSRNLVGVNAQEKYVRLFHKSLEHQFLDYILSFVPKEHDHIFLLRCSGLGEHYLLNFMIDALIQKNKIKNPCFVSWRSVYKDLCGMWNANIKFYHDKFCNLGVWNRFLLKKKYKYRGKVFHVCHTHLKQAAVLFGLGLKEGNDFIHYAEKIARIFGEKLQYKAPNISQDIWESMEEKTQHINKDKFIYLVPDARSTQALPLLFWKSLCDKLVKEGYDIFTNKVCGEVPYGKSAPLTIPEAYCLASRAKAIVSLRCGFTEILSAIQVPKHVIYSHYLREDLPAKLVMKGSSIKNYPGVDEETVFEYDYETDCDENIIHQILNNISQ